MARDADQKPTAVLQATRQVGVVTQGVMIISRNANPGRGDRRTGPGIPRAWCGGILTPISWPIPRPLRQRPAAAPAGTAPAVTLTPATSGYHEVVDGVAPVKESPVMFSLQNKTALVTGAGSGIGAAIAAAFAQAGAKVWVVDRDATTGGKTAARTRRRRGRGICPA